MALHIIPRFDEVNNQALYDDMVEDERKFYTDVYDVLVRIGGARPDGLSEFVLLSGGFREYRFQGHFGFGGKYWTERNQINYYPEDQTPELDAKAAEVNQALRDLEVKYGVDFS